MKPATLALITVIALILVGAGLFILSSDRSDTQTTTNTTQTPQANEATTQQPTTTQEEAEPLEQITADEVALHNQASDCWTIINGLVYDITAYVPRHPGGSVITEACGTDGTNLFEQRTTDDGQRIGSGTPHSSGAAQQLQQFLIGQLAN